MDGVHFSQPQPASEEKRGQAHGKEHRRSGRDKKRDRGGRGKDREGPRSRSPSKARKEEEGGRGGGRKGGGRGPKAPKGPITNEQLVANLSTIVDKRDKAGPGTGAGAAPLPSEERADGAGAADDGKDAREEAKTTTPVDARRITPAATPLPGRREGRARGGEDDDPRRCATYHARRHPPSRRRRGARGSDVLALEPKLGAPRKRGPRAVALLALSRWISGTRRRGGHRGGPRGGAPDHGVRDPGGRLGEHPEGGRGRRSAGQGCRARHHRGQPRRSQREEA